MNDPESEVERRRTAGRRRDDVPLASAAFAEAFVALTDGIILTDPDGRIVSANPAAFRILGEDALVGQVFEELLLVKGVTPQLLFGMDINRNGKLDNHEMLEENTQGASSNPDAFRGWSAYLTLYSVEPNVTKVVNGRMKLTSSVW